MLNTKIVKNYRYENIFELMKKHNEIDIKTNTVDIIMFICSANEYIILEDTNGDFFVIPYNKSLDKNFLDLYDIEYKDIIEIEIKG